MASKTELDALHALLSAPLKEETVHPADPRAASYTISFHVTVFPSRRAALAALKIAGFEYVRGTASNSKFGYMPGFWRRGRRRADVVDTTIFLR